MIEEAPSRPFTIGRTLSSSPAVSRKRAVSVPALAAMKYQVPLSIEMWFRVNEFSVSMMLGSAVTALMNAGLKWPRKSGVKTSLTAVSMLQ